jgi:hypothetical protein
VSVTIMANSGIMSDDRLDKLRSEAIWAHHDTPLPDAVVHYLRALEGDYLDRLHEQKKRDAREVGWRLTEGDPE